MGRSAVVTLVVAVLAALAVVPSAADPDARGTYEVFAAVDPGATDDAPPLEREPERPGETVLLVRGDVPDGTLREVGARSLDSPPRLLEQGIRRLAVPDGASESASAAFEASGADVEVEVRLAPLRTPSDPLWDQQWGAKQVGAPRLWDVTTGSTSVVIAVLDTGVDPHADLAGAFVQGYDIIGSGSTRDLSTDKHGTSVALVAAARANNGVGSAGYCWRCRIMPVRVLFDDGGFADDVAVGIDVAVAGGADVINLSLGGPCGEGTAPIEAAVRRARRAGVLVFAAAGNEASTSPTCPAASPGVVGVAGTGQDGRLAGQSNRGSWVDLAAPNCHVVASRSEGSGFCGTSSATPAAAGIAGAMLGGSPRLTPQIVEHVLGSSAASISGVRYGRVRADAAATRGSPLSGDWNGDGRHSPGWFVDGHWALATSSGRVDTFRFGAAGDVPVVGDWNGDGRYGVGIVRNGRWHLRQTPSGGVAQLPVFTYGRVRDGDVPIAGDWNGDGRFGVGIVRNGRWHLRQTPSGGRAHVQPFTYGRVRNGDVPVIGDWNGDGRSGIGIVRSGDWHLRRSPRGGSADLVARF